MTSRIGLDSNRFVTSTRAMATDDDGATTTTTTTSKIYTKTGDGGSSCLYNMERRDKDDAAFEALGDVDECNVAVGIAREFCLDEANGLEAEVCRRRATRAREGVWWDRERREETDCGRRAFSGRAARGDTESIVGRRIGGGDAVVWKFGE